MDKPSLSDRRRQWQPTPVLLPGKPCGRRSLVGCSPWGLKELDTTKWLYFHFSLSCLGEGHGNPLQYSCLENPRDSGAWWAVVHGVAKSQTRLSDFTFIFHFHALEKEMATHASVLAWRIPGMGEPGSLPSVGSHRVRHDWSDLAAAAARVYLQAPSKGVGDKSQICSNLVFEWEVFKRGRTEKLGLIIISWYFCDVS